MNYTTTAINYATELLSTLAGMFNDFDFSVTHTRYGGILLEMNSKVHQFVIDGDNNELEIMMYIKNPFNGQNEWHYYSTITLNDSLTMDTIFKNLLVKMDAALTESYEEDSDYYLMNDAA